MSAIRRILLAVKDPKARHPRALEKASQLAAAFGAHIELFHALTPSMHRPASSLERSLMQEREDWKDCCRSDLQLMASPLIDRGLKATASCDWGETAAKAIVRRAKAFKANLIVAEPHAGGALSSWLLHRTDVELLRQTPVPVLLVRSAGSYERPLVLAAIDPSRAHSKPARLDQAIVSEGRHFARVLNGSLHVLHAYSPEPLNPPSAEVMSDSEFEQLSAKAPRHARARLANAAARAHVPRAVRHLARGEAAGAIQRTARDIGADLVVMGTVPRSPLQRIFMGSTAERTLKTLVADVLVICASRPQTRSRRAFGRSLPFHLP